MGLYELFFSETSEAESLRKIANAHDRSSRVRVREFAEAKQQNNQVSSALENLENDVGTLALLLAAILKMLDEKGHLTRDDLKEALRDLDLLDGIKDGKISVNDLREGSFFQ